MNLEPITACRICQGTDLTPLFSLGDQLVSDFPEPSKAQDGVRCPIDLVLCRGCTLVQQRWTAPQDFMYSRFYWYRSGTTKTMRDALREVTAAVEGRLDLRAGDVVLDLGSNDGTALRSYAVEGLVKVGVEPASNMVQHYFDNKDGIQLINEFWKADDFDFAMNGKKARVVTALGCFYDLPDPNAFIADVAKTLSPDGMFVAQLMCLKQTLEQVDVGNLCHEHLLFFSLKSLKVLYERHGLEIFDVEENNVNGGSYRVWARLKENTLPPKPRGCVQRMQSAERWEAGFDDPKLYTHFYRRACANRDLCVEFVKRAKAKGKRTWIYGASTKGNVICQWYGLDSGMIDAAADKSAEKHGRIMVGSGIPIKSLGEFRAAKPDCAIILPYAFAKEIMSTEREWVQDGGRFFLALPSFKEVK